MGGEPEKKEKGAPPPPPFVLRCLRALLFNGLMMMIVPPVYFSGAIFYPLRFISLPVYRSFMRLNESVWGSVITSLTNALLPTRVVLTGDEPPARGASIVMANHQIYADWWYIWMVADGYRRAGDVKIVLKRSLRAIPVIGWAMRQWEFVFLARDWSKDEGTLKGAAGSLRDTRAPLWLIIFPEGTVHSTERREVMLEYARRTSETPPKHTLLPRVTGAHALRDALDGHLSHVVDVTMAYEGSPSTCDVEKLYTLGRIFHRADPPRAVHMHMRVFDASTVPRDRDGFEAWLKKVYAEKDSLLEGYFKKGKFPGREFKAPATSSLLGAAIKVAASCLVVWTAFKGVVALQSLVF